MHVESRWQSLPSRLPLLSHPFPPHDPTAYRKQYRAHYHPRNQYPKVKAEIISRAEEEGAGSVDYLTEWPDVAPAVEGGGELESVKAGGDVGYHPELEEMLVCGW